MEIKNSDIIKKINEKEKLELTDNEHYFYFNVLCMFLKDYFDTERLNEKTEAEILEYTKPEKNEATKILNLLLERGILLKSNRKTLNNDLIDIYCLSYAYINNIENMIKYAKTNYKPIKDEKTLDFLQSHLEAYRKYNEVVLNDISGILKECFNFYVEIDNGKIDFQMGGCDYNVYLSRGYIVLEEADNSTIDNVWTTESVEEFIDLIKDLKEDN